MPGASVFMETRRQGCKTNSRGEVTFTEKVGDHSHKSHEGLGGPVGLQTDLKKRLKKTAVKGYIISVKPKETSGLQL